MDQKIRDFAKTFYEESAHELENIELSLVQLEREPSNQELKTIIFNELSELKSLASLFEQIKVFDIINTIQTIFKKFNTNPELPGVDTIILFQDAIKHTKKHIEAIGYEQPIDTDKINKFLWSLKNLLLETQVSLGQVAAQATSKKNAKPKNYSGKILIIEDEVINRSLLEQIIINTSDKLSIISVDSAAEGLFHYFSTEFDLVFLDIMMPEIDGNDFIHMVERNQEKGNLKKISNIVVQTAIQSITDLTALARKDVVQEIIRKPIDARRVIDCIDRYCSNQAK